VYAFIKKLTPAPGSKGFSLIELLVALVFMGIGLLGVAAVFPLGTRFVNSSKITSTAIALSREKIEELEIASSVSPSMAQGSYSDTQGPFQRDWTITDDTPMSTMKRIQVTTSWDSPQGRRQVTLDTYVFL
jgi:prepilin-type N-terminal cleavage/methylation domain-containing protein